MALNNHHENCWRVLVGLDISMTTLAGLTVIIESIPLTAQGRANDLLEFSAIGGSAVSPTLSELMASFIHWRGAFALGALFIVGACAWVIFTRYALEEDTYTLTWKSASDNDTTPMGPPPADKAGVHLSHATAILIAYLATFLLSFT